jgi:molybdate transport system permease protein
LFVRFGSKLTRVLILILSLFVSATAPRRAGAADEPSHDAAEATASAVRPIALDAAASTSDAVQVIVADFRRATGIPVAIGLGASSTLAHQINQGAPVDLFLSASQEWARFLDDRGLVLEQVSLLGNRLVVIVPLGNPAGVSSLDDLKKPEVRRLALGDPEHVPAGIYAREALTRRQLWQPLQGRIVAADNVRTALAFVARGEADAGIVYETDAAAEPAVSIAARIEPALHAPIRYPLLLLRQTQSHQRARELYRYLQSDEAAAQFRTRGFTVLREPVAQGEPIAVGRPLEPATLGLSTLEWTALRLSLWVAACSVAISLPLGLALGYWLARRRFRGKALVETIVNLSLVLPPVVTGYLLLVVFGRRGLVGSWLERWLGLRVAFTWKAAALASAVVSFPLMVRAIRLAFQGVDTRLEQAARTLGAGPWNTFWTVSVPLARNGILAGCVLAFARSLGEFGATIMFAGNIEGQTQTIPVAIYTLINQPGGVERSWRLVAVSIVIAALALGLSEALERRGGPREPA